jgi:glycosyltransferase involved in cell wall biosynthesis
MNRRSVSGVTLVPDYDADLLSRIPLTARSILQVGYRNPGLIDAYRLMNPRARILGAPQPDVPLTRISASFDRVVTDADQLKNLDCIVFDDPTAPDIAALIGRYANCLGPDGTILMRLRNPYHWRIAEAVLRGTGKPVTGEPVTGEPVIGEPAIAVGGVDADALREPLGAQGLTVVDVTPQEDDVEAAERFVDALRSTLSALGIDAKRYHQRAIGHHAIWRLSKAPVARMVVAGNMLKPVGGVSHVRVVHPLHALASDPGVVTQVTDRLLVTEDETPRIFVLHRPALQGERGASVITALSEAGYIIVTEFDDHPDHFDMMRAGGELSFTGVHAIQTSTPTLAGELKKYNGEVGVFANALVSLAEVRNFANLDYMTFFFGALNREADWQPHMAVINEIAGLAGGRLRFQVVHDSQFFDALDTPYKTFTPTCDYPTYQRLLGDSEISFMPLSDTAFNRSKSDLKFIEAAAHRVAALASPIVYESTITSGKTGLIFRNPDELRLALMRLVALPNLTRALADSARDYVRQERMLAYQVAGRLEWYRSLWDRREALEMQRRKRLARYAGLAA